LKDNEVHHRLMNPPPFTDPVAIERYAEGARRNVPGHASLLSMSRILLAERVPADGRVLVIGAGGGLELEEFARHHGGWRFDGVDPSAPMLDLARRHLGELAARVHFHPGLVEQAPDGPFDGAACLLTLHFVPAAERLPMAREIRRRLRPGAPLVAAHMSIEDGQRDAWMARYAAFLVSSGGTPQQAAAAREKVERELGPCILSPARDEAILREAGFGAVHPFFMGFTFRGWVAYA